MNPSPATGAGRIPGAGRIASAAVLIALLTVASRLAGFGRTAVFTWVLYSDLGDMYVVANTVPNIIFEIVAGGALASLVVPLLAGAVSAGDRRAVAGTTTALLTWTVTILVPLAVVMALLAEPIIAALSDDQQQTASQIAAGARMLRIFAPQLPLYGIGIVLTGVLQAHRRFAWPVLAPLLSSVTVIGVYLAFAGLEGTGISVAEVGRSSELVLAGGTTLGVVVLSLSLLAPVRRLRLGLPRPTYAFSAAARRTVGGLAVAGAVAVAGQQIALLVMIKLANGGPTGSVVVFNQSQTMFLLPWAVLAVPLAVAAYPNLATAHAERDEGTYRRVLAPTARRVLLLSCLGAAALVATAAPVARFFFGNQAAPTGGPAAVAIAGFAPGLLGYGLFAVLTRALYARGGTRLASVATAAGWLTVPVAAAIMAALAPNSYRVAAVALGNSAGMLVLGLSLVLVVARHAGRSALAGLRRAALVGITAGAVAAFAGTVVAHALSGMPFETPARLAALVQGILSGVVVGGVFVAVAYPLDRGDLRPMIGALRRRLGRRSGTPGEAGEGAVGPAGHGATRANGQGATGLDRGEGKDS